MNPPRYKGIGGYEQPPELSARARWWIFRILDGWRPNKRVRGMGYSLRADFFGVCVWEQLNVIDKALDAC